MTDSEKSTQQRLPPTRVARWGSQAIAAAQLHQLDYLVLLAICERESHGGDALEPPGPAGLGDHGFGHGLMQIDSRAWTGWLAKGEWQDPQKSFNFAAALLRTNLDRFAQAFDPMFCAVAAYNCGGGAVHRQLGAFPANATDDQKRQLIDRHTTGGDYATAVLAHVTAWS